jgi:cytochrome c-type biogenesis protein
VTVPVQAVIAADPLGILVAFGAGMISFLSPCVLPLVPGYVSMVSGMSAVELNAPGARTRTTVLRGVGGFVAGFTIVFTALGATASGFGRLLQSHQRGLDEVAGLLVVLLGVWSIGLAVPKVFMMERRFHPRPSVLGPWAAPVMGMAFAFGWTPCIGPVLAGVSDLASRQRTLAAGVVLLVSYSLGLGVPFVATGLAFERLTELFARMRGHLKVVNVISGSGLIVFGLLLVLGDLHLLSSAVSTVMSHLGLNRLTVS